jgi:GT2 family glycosyltransferase
VEPSVSIGIVTWNSAGVIERCLAAIRQQTHPAIELLVVDNGSTDGTPRLLEHDTSERERLPLDRNVGFAAAHNLAIRKTSGDFYLALNPDVFLSPAFVATLVEATAQDPRIGAATGKLLSADDPTRIDSAGIYLLPAQRHLDRGQGERDQGQYQQAELVFGATGAAALYRRAMLDDVKIGAEYFDEDFFAYREDADLAWRAQLFGWDCLYSPSATALHVRRVTPDRRGSLPAAINRMSVRNRFFLRIKNQPLSQAARFAAPALWRDTQVLVYTLFVEHSSLPGLADVVRLFPRMLRKRHQIMARRRVPVSELNRWFAARSRPLNRSLLPADDSGKIKRL